MLIRLFFFLFDFFCKKYPGDGKQIPVEFPHPATSYQFIDGYNIISLSKLIELKLASYKRLPTSRLQDKADVVELIKVNNLQKSFADLLNPYVQDDFKDTIDNLREDQQKTEHSNEL